MDLSIIVLSYNASAYLKDCLESILKYTADLNFELIVVDNQSIDNSVEVIKSFGDKVRLIEAGENGGFSKGNNVGLKVAKGKYILLLNPDTLFLENSPKKMFDWMEKHEDVAVSSCQLLDGNKKVTATGGYFPTLSRIFAWGFFLDDLPVVANMLQSYHPHSSNFYVKDNRYEKEFFPDWVTGAFFFMRKTALDQAGLLDDNIFMYGEELEWCIRAKMGGWKVGYTPITKIVHLERKSSGGLPKNAVLGEFKGLKYIYGKHFPQWQQIVCGTLLDIAAFFRVIVWAVRLKPEMVKLYAQALLL